MRDDLPKGHPQKLELDHIIPASLGGPDVEANYTFRCGACNRRKGANPNPPPASPYVDGAESW